MTLANDNLPDNNTIFAKSLLFVQPSFLSTKMVRFVQHENHFIFKNIMTLYDVSLLRFLAQYKLQ